MTSKVVKCPTCNIVINEVLAFVSNKIDVVIEETISRICISAFSEADILEAKNLLFDSIPNVKRNIPRKGSGKTLREIDDIIWIFKNTIAEERPIFVARELQKLPPLLFDHLDATKLLKDILILKQDISLLREQSATVMQLDLLRTEVDSIKNLPRVNSLDAAMQGNVNKKRGAFVGNFDLNSGPIGLPPLSADAQLANNLDKSPHYKKSQYDYRDIVQPSYSSECENTPDSQSPKSLRPLPKRSAESSHIFSTCAVDSDKSGMSHKVTDRSLELAAMTSPSARAHAPIAAVHVALPPPLAQAPPTAQLTPAAAPARSSISAGITGCAEINNRECTKVSNASSMADIARRGEFKQQACSSEWTLVQKKRLRNRFIGNRGNAILCAEEKFKAADIKTPIYIYEVAKEVSSKDISEYVKNKSGLNVVVIQMKMKVEKEYNAFKIFVPKHKLSLFLSDDFWPENVAYRRFIDFRHRNTNMGNSVNNSVVRQPNILNE